MEAAQIWKGRKSAFGATGRIADYICMDGTVPTGQLPEALRRDDAICADEGLRVANVFHAGDGNMHPLILYNGNDPVEQEKAERAGARVLTMSVELGGCLTGEHGVGMEKRDLMSAQYTPRNWRSRSACARCSIPQGASTPPRCSRSRRGRRERSSRPPTSARPPRSCARPRRRSHRGGGHRAGSAVPAAPARCCRRRGSSGIVFHEPAEMTLRARAGHAGRRDRGGAGGAGPDAAVRADGPARALWHHGRADRRRLGGDGARRPAPAQRRRGARQHARRAASSTGAAKWSRRAGA